MTATWRDGGARLAAAREWAAGGAFLRPDGLPSAWFHGTDINAPFNVFARWEDFSLGFHFGSAEVANARLADIGMDEAAAPVIIPVWCRARRPLRLPDLFTWEQADVVDALYVAGAVDDEAAEFVEESASAEAVYAAIEEAGYDCVVYGNRCEFKERETDSLCVWRAELLKSPFAATFDARDPRLLPQSETAEADLGWWRATSTAIEEARSELRLLRAGREVAAPRRP